MGNNIMAFDVFATVSKGIMNEVARNPRAKSPEGRGF